MVDYLGSQEPVVVPGAPQLDPRRVLDAQRQLQIYRQLPVSSEGRQFEIQSRVAAVYDKGKSGSSVETEQILVDKETSLQYARFMSTKFYVGQGNWGGPRGPSAIKYQPPTEQEDQPHKTCKIQLSSESAHLYRYVFWS